MAIPRVPANPQFQFGALPDLCYGTIRTSPGVYSRRDAKNVCEAILNRNLADVAAVLSYRSFGQRRSILCWYEERLGDGRLLISDLIKTFGEDLREVVQAMLSPPEENNVRWVRNALGSTPINHMALVEILGVRSNAEISRIKEVYYQLFGVSLFEDIANQVTDECKNLLFSWLSGGTDEICDEQLVDQLQVHRLAEPIFLDPITHWLRPNSPFIQLMCRSSVCYKRQILEEVQVRFGRNITTLISETVFNCASTKRVIGAVIDQVIHRPRYFAKKLEFGRQNPRANLNLMIRVIVGRSEVDLQQIKTKYAALYHSHLAERLQEARATLPQSYTFLIGLLNGNR